ncbi:hypothetical protein AIIKEEIJ_01765 [Rhodococcus sp. YH1]|nr:hypothetical protein [Rhodococcus sp. YH1]
MWSATCMRPGIGSGVSRSASSARDRRIAPPSKTRAAATGEACGSGTVPRAPPTSANHVLPQATSETACAPAMRTPRRSRRTAKSSSSRQAAATAGASGWSRRSSTRTTSTASAPSRSQSAPNRSKTSRIAAGTGSSSPGGRIRSWRMTAPTVADRAPSRPPASDARLSTISDRAGRKPSMAGTAAIRSPGSVSRSGRGEEVDVVMRRLSPTTGALGGRATRIRGIWGRALRLWTSTAAAGVPAARCRCRLVACRVSRRARAPRSPRTPGPGWRCRRAPHRRTCTSPAPARRRPGRSGWSSTG